MARTSRFGFADFMVRWAIAIILVFATFNPLGYPYSFVAWLMEEPMNAQLPYKALMGIVLVVGYIVYLRATLRSIGPIGILLAAGFVGAIIWVAIDIGLIDPANPTIIMWIGLFVLAWVMAIGLSWSHVRRRVSGQADMDDVDEV